jgi:hypothetical protein
MRHFTKISFSLLIRSNRYSKANAWLSTIERGRGYSHGQMTHLEILIVFNPVLYSFIKYQTYKNIYAFSDPNSNESHQLKFIR